MTQDKDSGTESPKKFLREFFSKPDHEVSEFKYRDLLFFLRFIKTGLKTAVVALLLTVAGTAVGSLFPMGGKILIDYVLLKKAPSRLGETLASLHLGFLTAYVQNLFGQMNYVMLVLFFLGTAMGIIGLVKRYLLFRFEQEFTYDLQQALFDRVLSFPISFFRKEQTGYLTSRVSEDTAALQTLFSDGLAHIAANLFYAVFGTAILFSLNGTLASIAVGLVPVYVFFNLFYAVRIRIASFAEKESDAFASKEIQEVISGVETVKAYTAEESSVNRVSRKLRDAVQGRTRKMFGFLIANYSVRGFQFLSLLLLLWLGGNQMSGGTMSVGDLVAFISYVILISGSIQALSFFHLGLESALASAYRIKELFDLVPEEEYTPDGTKGSACAKGRISFNEVSFAYNGRDRVLDKVTFLVNPGDIVAIAGPSGAGKTTLMNLLLKFYSPDSGSISLDGKEFVSLSANWLRKQIGFVSQDIFLFNDSVESNIRYGRPGASPEDVITAAKLANIHQEIIAMKDEYRTEVGERGILLSAGQRQRISLARAFLKDAPILILDEPASALDSVSESLFRGSVSKLAAHKTTFIIAHRLSTIEIANRFLVLDRGKVMEISGKEELIGFVT